jgi:hypothetical protein
MKKSLKTLILILFIPVFTYSQIVSDEFEGIIKYNHKVIAKDSSYNVEYDYSGIGKNSEYYYKEGDYIFVNHNSYFKADLFKSKELHNYLILNNSDTVFYLDSKVSDIEVIEYNIKESADTILNYPCDLITLKLKPVNKESPISFRRYYFSKQLHINPDHFKQCKGNAYELIYENTKSLALKIEYEWPNKVITWEAYEVTKQKLDDAIFKKQNNWILMKIN